MFKKLIAIVLLAAMALTLCACGKMAEPAAPTDTPEPTAEPTPDPAAEIEAAAALFYEGK